MGLLVGSYFWFVLYAFITLSHALRHDNAIESCTQVFIKAAENVLAQNFEDLWVASKVVDRCSSQYPFPLLLSFPPSSYYSTSIQLLQLPMREVNSVDPDEQSLHDSNAIASCTAENVLD